MNVVSEIKGPNAFILNLFNSFFIAGIIILISSDFFLTLHCVD